jgi:hypothetical protein
MTIEMTEAQAEAEVRASRLRVALEEAPATMEHLRSLIEVSDGRTERGEVFTYARTPLLTHVADDADQAYALLVAWTMRWAQRLNLTPPSTAVVAYRVDRRLAVDEAMGFNPGTTPAGARGLTQLLTTWLLIHEDQIDRRDDAQDYQDDIAKIIWRIRSARGLTEVPPVTRAVLRQCPYGHEEVRAVYFAEPLVFAEARGEFDFELAEYDALKPIPDSKRDPNARAGRQILDAVEGVRVTCGRCGWSARPKVSEIARWLG